MGKPICMVAGWPTLPLFFPIHIQLAKHSIMQMGALVPPPMLLMIMMAEAAAVLGRHFFYSIISSSSNFIASLHHQFFSGRNRFFSFLFLSSFLFLPFSSVFILHFFVIAVFCHHQDHLPSPQCETWQLPTVSRAYYHFSFLSLFSLLLHT